MFYQLRKLTRLVSPPRGVSHGTPPTAVGIVGVVLLVCLPLAAISEFLLPRDTPSTTASAPAPQAVQSKGTRNDAPPAIQIIDGDTIRYGGVTVRLVGFNAPETGQRALCEAERRLGQQATRRLQELVSGGSVGFKLVACSCPPDTEGTQKCNFGRRCGVLTANGRDVGAMLISERLAAPFRCGATSCPPPPRPWC